MMLAAVAVKLLSSSCFTKPKNALGRKCEGNTMGLFTGVEEAKMFQGGIYAKEGRYEVAIQSMKMIESRKKENFMVVEFEILSAKKTGTQEPSGVGVKASYMMKAGQDSFLGNAKAVVTAATAELSGEDFDSVKVTTADMDLAVSDENPFNGVVLNLDVVAVKTKKGTDYSKHIWSPRKASA